MKRETRAFLFTGGEGPALSKAAPLIKGSAFIAAADSGLIAAMQAGLHPDLIIGDMDSLSCKGLIEECPQAEVIRMQNAKDLSDTEAALRLLKERGFGDITLIGASGGRLDHLIAVLRLFETDFAPTLWLTKSSCAAFLQAGKDASLVATGLDVDDVVSVFALGTAPHKIEETGLKWPLDIPWDGEDASRPIRDSLSNWVKGDEVELTPICGNFLCVFPLKGSLKLERQRTSP